MPDKTAALAEACIPDFEIRTFNHSGMIVEDASMSRNRLTSGLFRRHYLPLLLGAVLVPILLPAISQSAKADETFKEIAAMPVATTPLKGFDISFEEPVLDIYMFADRTNKSVDVFDADQLTPLFQIGGFAGVATSCGSGNANDCSGPDGVATVHHRYVYAGDGDSTVKVIDLLTQKIIKTISTGGKYRADELAVDPRDQIIAIANDADSPPFLTFISTQSQTVLGKLPFSTATNGLEQTVWNPRTGLFYTSVPELNKNTGHGEIAVISPKGMKITRTFPVDCEPAGLAIGPHNQALVGCSDAPVLVMDLTNGHVLKTFPTIAHADQVWYNPGDNHYFAAAGSDPSGPVLGVIDAESLQADATVKTVVGDHSVAADPLRNNVFVPSDPDPSDANCTQGCVKVFAPNGQDDRAAAHDHGHGIFANR